MTTELPSFQRYQQAFSAYIRDPLQQPRPAGVTAKRMNVYKEIVFNNLFESVSACFPVTQKVLGKRAWRALVRRFFREHSSNSPMFRQIPEEFVSYLTNNRLSNESNLPLYLASLCHYEWIELLVSSMVDVSDVAAVSAIQNVDLKADLLAYRPAFTQSLQLLNYDYAVHKISARYKPKEAINTQLLVYRNAEYIVKFVELNPVTYRLIELLQNHAHTYQQALALVANELNHPQPESVVQFGLEILNDLRAQGIILGVYR